MDEKNLQQFAHNGSALTSVVSSENYTNVADGGDGNEISNSNEISNGISNGNEINKGNEISNGNETVDFLSLLAGVQSLSTNQAHNFASNASTASTTPTASSEESQLNATPETSFSASQEGGEEKRRHHLWHRLSTKQDGNKSSESKKDNTPHFTPLPNAPKPPQSPSGIFDARDGQIFDATTRLRLHTLIATCLMNGIDDSRVNAFMHLLQWPDAPKMIVIAGSFGTKITPDDGPNRKPAPATPPDNTDALRRNIWPQLGSCNAYDAIVERTQQSALQRIAGAWKTVQAVTGNTGEFAAPSHIIILAVRETPSDQALEKLCQVFVPSRETVCVSSMVEGVENVASALTATLAAVAVAPAVQHLPQIIRVDDVLPERALIGDVTAFDTLYHKVYQSLAPYNHDDPTLATIDMFLRFGGALDQTAHELNVHPNTVRYRLRKVAQTTGWDATDPRAAYVLQTAITIGRIRDSRSHII